MNQSQFMSLVKTLLGAAGGFVIAKGWTDASTVASVSGAALMLAPLLWGLISHTDAANAQTVAAVDGVKVVVAPNAPYALQALARDPSVKDIVKA